jgi:eukaryotic-like serine/threonine-protein kinase
MDENADRYWAFISYSHADERWARWLHGALERYRIPSHIVDRRTRVGVVPKRLFPVFRDRDELAGAASLGPELQEALRASRTMIVICSPAAAGSRWVDEEIRYFKSLGRADRVLALVIDGESPQCFPDALRREVDAGGRMGNVPVDPVAADARPGADGKHNALLKLVAGLLDVGYDELRQRDLQARHRRLAWIASGATAMSAITALLAVQAYQARDDAMRRQQQAEDLIQFMLGDLREKLEPIGRLAILDAVGQKAMDYFATLDQRDQTDAALASHARALRQIGEVRLRQGKLPEAAEAFGEAERVHAELIRRNPRDTHLLSETARTEFALGNAHYLKGEFDEALLWIRRHQASAAMLVAREPDNPDWLSMAADASANLGGIDYQRGALEEAHAHFRQARDAHQRLLEEHPDQDRFIELLAESHGWLSTVEHAQRQWQSAAENAHREAELLRQLTTRAPDNANHRWNLLTALTRELVNLWKLQPIPPDDPILTEALALSGALEELDSQNVDYRDVHRALLDHMLQAQLLAGDLDAAAQISAQSLAISRELTERAPDRASFWQDRFASYARSIKLAALRNDNATITGLLAEARALEASEEPPVVPPERWLELHLLGWSHADNAQAREHHVRAAIERLAQLQASGLSVSPELMLRHSTLKGDREAARSWAAALSDAERTHPFVQALLHHH